MPISKKWSYYTKDNVNREDDYFGVYEIGHIESGEVLYMGEGRVRSRLLAHLPDGTRYHENVVGANGYRCEYTGSKERAIQRQNALLRDFMNDYGELPKFNQRRRN